MLYKALFLSAIVATAKAQSATAVCQAGANVYRSLTNDGTCAGAAGGLVTTFNLLVSSSGSTCTVDTAPIGAATTCAGLANAYDTACTNLYSCAANEAAPCFPSSAFVTKADGTPVRIDALTEGDEILAATTAGALKTDTVSLLSIADKETGAAFVSLSTEAGAKINLTEEHHLAVGDKCCSSLKVAKDVEVGEKVWVVDNAHPLPVAQKVAGKATVKEVGLHSPVLTHGGMPIVGGFVTAFDSIEVVKTAEAGLPALLAMCKATKTCDLLKGAFKFNNRPHVAVEA